jgi:hypothetical protein
MGLMGDGKPVQRIVIPFVFFCIQSRDGRRWERG